ncbi:MAG: 30S ribosomal protein S20 [Myxococcales bacterium]|nr:30S ribosomal protein S20 [Myxococcales bacterium]
MAHHKDAIKRIRTSEAARGRNRAGRSRLRTQLRSIREKIDAGDAAVAVASLPATMSELHKLAGKGIIHRKNAARRISRLAKAIKAMEAAKK